MYTVYIVLRKSFHCVETRCQPLPNVISISIESILVNVSMDFVELLHRNANIASPTTQSSNQPLDRCYIPFRRCGGEIGRSSSTIKIDANGCGIRPVVAASSSSSSPSLSQSSLSSSSSNQWQ